ncbi:MAG: tRNA A37 threonylcarbamoyladenosine dehydratase [Parasphingorhabdus sp.]|jgi:tRNA A37 threonylcarbamoyladenosine dehydratase
MVPFARTNREPYPSFFTLNQSAISNRRFGGIARLYGEPALSQFSHSHICVIGVGGVGSWVVESLARSGIGQLTLIDMDHVAESNINRQIHADDQTLGKAKIKAMAERVHLINPACRVNQIDDFISRDNARELLQQDYDFVVDCADNFQVKSEIVYQCRRNKMQLITVGGAGGQINPALIKVADLARTEHDPLLAKVRRQLRVHYGFSRNLKRRFDIACVYSTEHLSFPGADGTIVREKSLAVTATGLGCAGGLGSATHVTASFAFHATGHVLKKLAQSAINSE